MAKRVVWQGRADRDQAKIVAALRQILGVRVKVLSGHPAQLDLLVGFRGRLHWIELKTSEKDKLTPVEQAIFDNWGDLVHRCNGLNDVLRLLGILE